MSTIPKSTKLTSSTQFAQLDPEFQKSFRKDPVPVLVELPSGFQVYKWAGTSHIDKKTGHRVRHDIFDQNGISTPYWSPWAAMPAYKALGFAEIRKRDRNIRGGVGYPQEMARARLAVTREWSEMNSLLKAELQHSAWAFVGVCSLQLFSVNQRDDDPGFFPGGDHQLVIPGLTSADIFKL